MNLGLSIALSHEGDSMWSSTRVDPWSTIIFDVFTSMISLWHLNCSCLYCSQMTLCNGPNLNGLIEDANKELKLVYTWVKVNKLKKVTKKVTKLKKLQKIQILKFCNRADTGCGTDGQTDRRTG